MAFIARSTLYDAPGGDTIQLLETARQLRALGVEVNVHLTTEHIAYRQYDLFHFSNLTRPADILSHLDKIKKPFTVSPLLIDYSEYDHHQRRGISGLVLRQFPGSMNEYIKTIARWLSNKDALPAKSYLWKGQNRSIREVLERAAWILPNSTTEYEALSKQYQINKKYSVVPNGIDAEVFSASEKNLQKDNLLVICAARIEGIKNQLNLIRALNNTRFTLMLIGSAAPNQQSYYEECKQIAASNIVFKDRVTQSVLSQYYSSAKVHVLPSWFETCGLSSLEAAAMGCNIVVTRKGYTSDYFGDDAFYCNPGDPASILEAVETASISPLSVALQEKIFTKYTWQQAAVITLNAYNQIISA